LCDKQNKVVFNFAQCDVPSLETEKITLFGLRLRNVYVINRDSVVLENLACFEVVNDTAWLWHRRLGHASMNIIKKQAWFSKRLPNHKDNKDQLCGPYVTCK